MAEKTDKKQKGGGLKVLEIVLGSIVLLGVVLYVALLKPATPKAICNNAYKLMENEAKAKLGASADKAKIEKMIGLTVDECIKDETDRRDGFGWQNAGLLPKAKYTKCLASVKTMDEYKKCKL